MVFEKYSLGSLSAKGAHQICRALSTELKERCPEQIRLIGKNSVENAQRDVQLIAQSVGDVEVDVFELVIDLCGEKLRLPIIQPFEIFASIFKHGDVQQRVSLFGTSGSSSVLDFWQAIEIIEYFAESEYLTALAPEQLANILPILWHSDGGDVFTNVEFVTFSCSYDISDYTF